MSTGCPVGEVSLTARWVRVRLGAIVAMTALLGAGGQPAAAVTASITGVVTAEDTGLPLSGVCVSANDVDTFANVASGCTDVSGAYRLDGLTEGTSYRLQAVSFDPGYLPEWFDGVDDVFDSTPVAVPGVVEFTLRPAITASGTLTYSSGSPVVGASVTFETTALASIPFNATTGADGTWSTQVAAGDYLVAFNDGQGTERWAFGQLDNTTADVIHAVAGTPLVVDDVLPAPGAVHGRVVAAADGTPLAGICVSLAAPQSSDLFSQQVCTTATGRFALTGVPVGRYIAVATDPTGALAARISAPFEVTAGSRVTGIRLAMVPGATLTGVLLDDVTGLPLRGMCVNPSRPDQSSFLGLVSTCANTTGRWTVKGLPTAKVILQISGDATHPLVWAPLGATPALGARYQATSGVRSVVPTVRLPLGGSLTGKITAPDGTPVAGACVYLGANYPWRAGPGEALHAACPGANGRYTIKNLPRWTTPAIVYTFDQPFAIQWSGPATDQTTARKLLLDFGTRKVFNAQFAPEARLQVTLNGAPAGFTLIDPLALSGAGVGSGLDLQDGSTGTLGLLPTSSIKLRITLPTGRIFYYPSATTVAAATPIPVTVGATASVTITVPPA